MDWKLGRLKLPCVAITAAVLALAGCNSPERDVHDTVKKMLKDPESAQFAAGTLVIGEGAARIACGKVNSKNAYGGYVGDRSFMVWSDSLYIASDEVESINIKTCCSLLHTASTLNQTQLSPEGAVYCHKIPNGYPLILLKDHSRVEA